ncbi:Txe/YoeB family addiction module toxin [Clostridium sp. WILCCON 0269]|uniref:Endoribonuclease YoeB n=1 Tax=Candidatus Clostridium eludens TaxID=3381663 RepID=A0ABW8SRD1_9CLOT
MRILFSQIAWNEYTNWQQEDKKVLKKINQLIKDIQRNGVDVGIGSPEPLKYQFSGYWSRRITIEHRLVYKIANDDTLYIAKCEGHY